MEIKGKRLLREFIESQTFQAWDSDNRSPGSAGMILEDPERWNRIEDAAENGAEGSTHREIIQDWRDAAATLVRIDPDIDPDDPTPTDLDLGFIREEDFEALTQHINSVEAWHEKNGSLDQEVG